MIKTVNGTSFSTETKITSPSLVSCISNTKSYQMLVLPDKTVTYNNKIYSYTKGTAPSFAVRYNGQTYYTPNTVKQAHDIPAGSYDPTTFLSIIRNFISANGNRIVSNAFTVTVNNQEYSVPAGRYVYYTEQYGGTCKFVSFNGSSRIAELFERSFTEGIYCVGWSSLLSKTSQGSSYSSFNIIVTPGISFK